MIQVKTLDSYNGKEASIALIMEESARGKKIYYIKFCGVSGENINIDTLSYEHGEKLYKLIYMGLVGYYIDDAGKPLYRNEDGSITTERNKN